MLNERPATPTQGGEPNEHSLQSGNVELLGRNQPPVRPVSRHTDGADRTPALHGVQAWNDSASLDLLEETERRMALEAELRELRRAANHKEQQIRLACRERSDLAWSLTLALSVVLFCGALVFARHFWTRNNGYRDLAKSVAVSKVKPTPSDEEAAMILTDSDFVVWKSLTPSLQRQYLAARLAALRFAAWWCTILSLLSAVAPALVTVRVRDWWSSYGVQKGGAIAAATALLACGAWYLPFAVWFGFAGAVTAAAAAVVGAAMHIFHSYTMLSNAGAFHMTAGAASEAELDDHERVATRLWETLQQREKQQAT